MAEGGSFSFAKVWSAEQDVEETSDERAQEDAWAQTLARIAEERSKEQAKEETGRGVRRKAAAVFPQVGVSVASFEYTHFAVANVRVLRQPYKGEVQKRKRQAKGH